MQIPILVETVGTDLFRVAAPAPFNVSAEGKTADEALAKLRARIAEEFSNGKRIVAMELPLAESPAWLKYAGHLKGDGFLTDFQESLKTYRRMRDPDDE